MKLNMETSYIPVSNIYQIKDMMDSWKTTSERCKMFAYICSFSSLFTGGVFAFDKNASWWFHLICGVLFLAGGYLVKKWKYFGFVTVITASLLSFASLMFPLPSNNWLLGCMYALCIMGLPSLLYAYKLMFNYRHVFKELEKLKGFPNFIANTADLYGDKMYLKDKKAKNKTLYDNKTEVAFNPFNTEEDYKNESFIRQQEYKEEKVPERLEKNITVESVNGVAPEKTEKTYKYGKMFLGRWIIFPHNTWREDTFDEKKDWMGYWRMNTEYPTQRFPEFMMLLLFNAIAATLMIERNPLPYIILIMVSILGTNQMKLDKWYGAVVTAAALLFGFISNIHFGNPAGSIACMFLYLCALLVNNGMVFGTIRFMLNYRTYKELSVMEGFPTFVRTTADLYGDKIYIVEKREPVVKKDPSQRQVKVMDIGYDKPKKEKKEDKGWNAFDYMDETDDG